MNEKKYWRSLHHLAKSGEYQELTKHEFPALPETADGMSRRNFLALMSASMAMAGLSGCRKPVEKVIPYVIQPENIVPGIASRYATAMPFGLNAFGVIVETHEGRPTKIETNPKHPSTPGGSHPFILAEILNLYDPDRSQSVMKNGAPSSWDDFTASYKQDLPKIKQQRGKGLAVLSESFRSPTLFRLKEQFLREFPEALWYTFEAVSDENAVNGIRLLAGGDSGRPDAGRSITDYFPVYHADRAKVILSLDADFLYSETNAVAHTHGFMSGRRINGGTRSMNRLYAVESLLTPTGAAADHRILLQSSRITAWLIQLAGELKNMGLSMPSFHASAPKAAEGKDAIRLKAVAADLLKNRGECLLICGQHQPAIAHAMTHALNHALGNSGKTVTYHELKDASVSDRPSVLELISKMNSGGIQTLVMLGTNPAYHAGKDFADALKKAARTIHLSDRMDETSSLCEWHIPRAHFMEQWGDVRSSDGTLSVIQPLIEPLFGSHSLEELLHVLLTGENQRVYEIVRETWKTIIGGITFEKNWRKTLHDGFMADSALLAKDVTFTFESVNEFLKSNPGLLTGGTDTEIVFRPSLNVFDGRYSNNGWLQEMPDPVTKITWDNVALIGPSLAKSLGVKNILQNGKSKQPLVKIQLDGKELALPVWVLPGHADRSVTVMLGYGRTAAGRIGNGVGQNASALMRSSSLIETGVLLSVTETTHMIACVQDHGGLDEEELVKKTIDKRLPVFVREATLKQYQADPDFAKEGRINPALTPYVGKDGKPKSVYNSPREYNTGYQWGMAIDLNACTGCNACMIACQSENNIPVVGKEQVVNGREMHWMRVDRYFSGSPEEPETVFQPMTCHHCENAPCEQVCPVVATVHDREGLNLMVYNRCVGTRYCANNCPYKVRRFNFLDYNGSASGLFQSEMPEILKMSKNPDVSVRMRGVMEKCTFCIQRISESKLAAKKDNRELKDGELQTACQQACPANAIKFGNILDPDSEIAGIKKHNLNYVLLEELNIRPRLSYLAKLRNPNPDMNETA